MRRASNGPWKTKTANEANEARNELITPWQARYHTRRTSWLHHHSTPSKQGIGLSRTMSIAPRARTPSTTGRHHPVPRMPLPCQYVLRSHYKCVVCFFGGSGSPEKGHQRGSRGARDTVAWDSIALALVLAGIHAWMVYYRTRCGRCNVSRGAWDRHRARAWG